MVLQQTQLAFQKMSNKQIKNGQNKSGVSISNLYATKKDQDNENTIKQHSSINSKSAPIKHKHARNKVMS